MTLTEAERGKAARLHTSFVRIRYFAAEIDLIQAERSDSAARRQAQLLRLECAAKIALNPLVELVELHLAVLFGAFIHLLRILLFQLVDEELRLAKDLRDHT